MKLPIFTFLVIIGTLALAEKASAITYDPCPYADDIIVATIIMEAGGEYHTGALEAVYEVIKTRAKKRNKTLAQICLQRKQFSCWNGITPKEGIEKASKHPRWNEALKLAYYKSQTNYTKGADH